MIWSFLNFYLVLIRSGDLRLWDGFVTVVFRGLVGVVDFKGEPR